MTPRITTILLLLSLLLAPNGVRPHGQSTPAQGPQTQLPARYVGSRACQACHADIYARWQKTPMANVVRDPREHPEAILPDLSSNNVKKFSREDVGLVYGSIWKQRYFTKIGDDYYPQPSQWDIMNHVWRAYFVPNDADWWAPLYPPDNSKRPTSALCDGCHSVNFNIRDHSVTEWNVGCERCHGPGSEHVAQPSRTNIQNPARMDYVHANDTCIQCHSQGRPPTNPIEGKYYDWPVGFYVGLNLQDYWQLEEHKLGETSFTHFADSTAHKNRMQGNDFVQSVMYRRGITCFNCHDVHGTANYAELRLPPNQICLTCHGPGMPNGPRTATLEEHTHHRAGTPGSECVSCHMPAIETTIANVNVHAHTFAFITPAMTEKYKIPNACISCHADKTTAWATDALRHWPERSPWRVE
jgi:predicted CXXCH cytochrome family protein